MFCPSSYGLQWNAVGTKLPFSRKSDQDLGHHCELASELSKDIVFPEADVN